jgi:hypothetical protein
MPLSRKGRCGKALNVDGEARRPAFEWYRRNLLGKGFSVGDIIEGQANRVQPFKPSNRFEGFLFLAGEPAL